MIAYMPVCLNEIHIYIRRNESELRNAKFESKLSTFFVRQLYGAMNLEKQKKFT